MKKKSLLQNNSGSIVILAFFIMMIMTIVSIVISQIIVGSLFLSFNLDHAVLAYYGAESGIEKGLYETRKLDITSAQSSPVDLGNSVMWTRSISFLNDSISFNRIEKNKSVQIDLYDPEYPQCNGPDILCTFDSIKLTWDSGSTVQLQYSEWDTGSSITWAPTEATEKKFQSSVSDWVINDLTPNKNYRVKIKALFGPITNLTVVTYANDDATPPVVPIPNYLTITADGDYGNSKQALQVTIPRKAPLSSLFDYVIFTEESLIKEL